MDWRSICLGAVAVLFFDVRITGWHFEIGTTNVAIAKLKSFRWWFLGISAVSLGVFLGLSVLNLNSGPEKQRNPSATPSETTVLVECVGSPGTLIAPASGQVTVFQLFQKSVEAGIDITPLTYSAAPGSRLDVTNNPMQGLHGCTVTNYGKLPLLQVRIPFHLVVLEAEKIAAGELRGGKVHSENILTVPIARLDVGPDESKTFYFQNFDPVFMHVILPTEISGQKLGSDEHVAIHLIVPAEKSFFLSPPPAHPTRHLTAAKPSVLLTYESDRPVLYNKADTFYLVGDKLGDEPRDMTPPPRLVTKDAYYYFLTDRLKAWALAKFGQDANQLVPFEIYLADESQSKKFTAKFALLIIIQKGTVSVNAQNFGVTDEQW
jgi:hypothetical protein